MFFFSQNTSASSYSLHQINARIPPLCFSLFFFNDTATTEIYTLSLHDALPISKKVVANIYPVLHVHGVLAVSELGRAYATDSDDGQVYVISERTDSIIAKIPLGRDDGPDGLAYDPSTRQVYISDETGQNDAVIDTGSNKQVAMIPLGCEAGNTHYDHVSHHIFVDVQTLNQLAAINPATRKVVAYYPVPGCNHDHGLNIDSSQRLAFISCDGNNMLFMMDMRSMKVI